MCIYMSGGFYTSLFEVTSFGMNNYFQKALYIGALFTVTPNFEILEIETDAQGFSQNFSKPNSIAC